MLLIAESADLLEEYARVLSEEGHHVDQVLSGIEANDLILAGLAVGRPYQLIILHHSQNKEDSRQLIAYWRNQDPFLPLVLVAPPNTLTDSRLHDYGLMDCIPEDVPMKIVKSRLGLLQQTIALGATFRLKSDILTKPALESDLNRAIDAAIDQTKHQIATRGVAFVTYTASESDPIMQFARGLEIYDQLWLDDLCEQPALRLEPFMRSNRMQFEVSESPRYIFPLISSRGWEGVLVFFAPDRSGGEMDPVLAGQYTTIANGYRFMIEHVRARESLVHAKQSKSEYMNILSQRIRNPISDLDSTSDLILMVQCDPTVKELTQKMAYNAKMAISMLEDVIELGRIDDGMLVIHPVELPMRGFMQRMVKRLNLMFEEKGLMVAFEDPDTEEAKAVGDPEKLKRVFTNILTNAARYSPENATITIGIHREDDGWVRTSVTDLGPGIAPEQRELIFQRPISGEHASITEQGIGLYLCRKFITAHDGKIWVESDLGLGSTFHVRLPPPDTRWGD